MAEGKPVGATESKFPVTTPTKLQIVHRNQMFRECLVAVLSRDGRFEVSALDYEAISNHENEMSISSDIILIDAGLPSRLAIDLIQRVRRENATTKILAVVSATAQDLVTDCIAAGAHGCVLEESSLDDLLAGIAAVQAGESFCSQDILQVVFSQLGQISRESQLRKQVRSVDLTHRELEILQLIAGHLGNKQIAKRLSVSLFTVKNHVHNILEKLELTSRFEAVDYARQKHWIANLAPETRESQNAGSRALRIH